jgi:hypothetical protein
MISFFLFGFVYPHHQQFLINMVADFFMGGGLGEHPLISNYGVVFEQFSFDAEAIKSHYFRSACK